MTFTSNYGFSKENSTHIRLLYFQSISHSFGKVKWLQFSTKYNTILTIPTGTPKVKSILTHCTKWLIFRTIFWRTINTLAALKIHLVSSSLFEMSCLFWIHSSYQAIWFSSRKKQILSNTTLICVYVSGLFDFWFPYIVCCFFWFSISNWY